MSKYRVIPAVASIAQLIISLFLITTTSHSQSKPTHQWYLNRSNGGLCSSSLVLFSDSTYCSESGCEQTSHFSFGRWTQAKNIITFIPVKRDSFNVIRRVERTKASDQNLTVTLFDKYGENISQLIVIGLYIQGKGMFGFDLDSTGTKRIILRRENGTIVLSTLSRIFRKKLWVETDSVNNYKIYLNISGQWNFHKDSNWENDNTFSVKKNGDKLVTGNGDLTSREYIRQKD